MNAFVQRLRCLFTVRRVIWFLFSLLTLIAVLFAWGNWSGARRWAETKSLLEREGESLDFKALLPRAPAEGLNFCAIPALRDITLPGDANSPQAIKRKALETMAKSKEKPPVPVTGGPALARKMDLQAWIKFARESKLLNASSDAPGDMLQAFDQAYPVGKELAAATATRPEAAFIPTLKERTLPRLLYSMEVPHYSGAQPSSRALRLRAALALAAGDATAAAQSIQATLRFTDALLQEPLLISYLVAITTHEAGQEGLWDLLEKRTATETDLAAVQTSLERLDFAKAELSAIRGELATSINAIESVQGNRESANALVAVMQSLPTESNPTPANFAFLRHLLPSGFFDHNKATLGRLYNDYFIEPLKTGDMIRVRAKAAELPNELRLHRPPLHLSYVFANLAMPTLSPVHDRGCAAETIRRQALIACALERYFIQHQSYPAHLSQLVPAFLPNIPNDPMDNQPMRYRQTASARYILWSVASDQKDDAGVVKLPSNNKPAISTIYKAGYQGDWAWQYEEVK
jgi:hypothetical protein